LAHQLPNVALAGLVDTDGSLEVAVPFRASNLQIDTIRTYDGQYVTPTDFRQSALTRCSK